MQNRKMKSGTTMGKNSQIFNDPTLHFVLFIFHFAFIIYKSTYYEHLNFKNTGSSPD
jgi:hypothetical protein